MAVRLGMADLITRVRQYGQCDTDEYTLAGETYWQDSHILDVLDRNRSDIWREPLEVQSEYVGGTTYYYTYYFSHANVEQAESGSAAWRIEDSAGSAVSTADYTIEYHARRIRFDADTQGTVYYLTYRSYNPEMAASEIWNTKAANSALSYDVSTDNHSLKRSQKFDHCVQMATFWRNRALASGGAGGSGFTMLTRSDVNG